MQVAEVRAGGAFHMVGRTLSGRVMTYGDVAIIPVDGGVVRERFAPGAFGPAPSASLNIQHDPNMIALTAGEVALTDTPQALELRGELPENSAALSLVRSGALNGLSVEFHSRAEHRESGTRVIERAELVGIGLVDEPSYRASTVEVRDRKRLATLRGRIPVNERLECRCGPGDCSEAIFRHGAFRGIVGTNLKDEDLRRDVLAVVGEYSAPLGSRKRGSVRFWEGEDGGLEFAVDVPNTQRGRDVLETAGSVDLYIRPNLDLGLSKYRTRNAIADYSHAAVRALVVGATDAAKGWVAATVTDIAVDIAKDVALGALAAAVAKGGRPRRRRAWLP
ncbi:MAG: hypothetical protein F4059_05650 [Gemmatimonadetes bacterium]|nr:hypothetical protein [Gemmatimonadota bacterium]